MPVLRPRLPSAERLLPYLTRIDDTRIYSNYGPLVLEFEHRMSEHLGLPPGCFVSASCGTMALVGAILASAGRASEKRPFALLPAFTFMATGAAVEQCGYRPYLADVDPRDWMLNPQTLLDHPTLDRIGLIVPVAPFGRPVPLRQWSEFRDRTGVPIVIDGAASFEGLADSGDRCLGDIPVAVSFHATKSFGTGEGGAIASNDIQLSERLRAVMNFGFYGGRNSSCASTNGKMSEYHAAIGLAELDGWAAKRAALRAIADHYRHILHESGLENRFFGAPDIAGCYALFQCTEAEQIHIFYSLQRHGIDFRLWYGSGLHHHTYFAEVARDPLAITESLARCLLGLPVAPDLTERTIERVAMALKSGILAR